MVSKAIFCSIKNNVALLEHYMWFILVQYMFNTLYMSYDYTVSLLHCIVNNPFKHLILYVYNVYVVTTSLD